jgi:hypothetical protein
VPRGQSDGSVLPYSRLSRPAVTEIALLFNIKCSANMVTAWHERMTKRFTVRIRSVSSFLYFLKIKTFICYECKSI